MVVMPMHQKIIAGFFALPPQMVRFLQRQIAISSDQSGKTPHGI